MSSVPTAGMTETLRRVGKTLQSSGTVREWSSEAEVGEAPSLISLTAFAVGFQGSCSQKPEVQPLGEMAAVGYQLLSPSWTLSTCGREDTKLLRALLLQKIIPPQAFISQTKCKLSCRNVSHFSRLSTARTSIF